MALLFVPAAIAQVASTAPHSFTVARLQIALERRGFGVGPIDGREGPRTRQALADFCRATGMSEPAARRKLLAEPNPLTTWTLSANDLAQIGVAPEDWLEAAQVPRMAYTNLEELVGEQFHVAPAYLRALNPAITNWTLLTAGTIITVPNVWAPRLPPAARLEVHCGDLRLRAYGTNDALVASFPCSIAMDFARVPTGELRVVTFAPNPNYTFDPANFPESPRAQAIGRKLIIPPGPNNPVGVYWLSLNAPGFGIHGTHRPETIGRRESHGCFRLTNWDIATLARMITVGTPVRVLGADELRP